MKSWANATASARKDGSELDYLGSAIDSPVAEGLVSTTSYTTWCDLATFSSAPPLLFPLMNEQRVSAP